MPAKTRINGQNYTQLPRLVSDDVILKGLPQTPGAPAGYGDLADAVNAVYSFSSEQIKSKKPRIMFIGDSLTGSGTSPLSETGLTYKLNAGISQLSGWVTDAELDPVATGTLSGQLKTDGDGTIQFLFTGDAFGEKVDVSDGGFFSVPSANGIRCFVKIVKSNQPVISRLDSITFLSLRTNLQVGGLNTFAEYIKCNISSKAEVFNSGIISDTVAGVKSRWLQSFNLFNPDYIFLMVGTNDAPADNSAADNMFVDLSETLTAMLEKVGAVFVGGLFPRAGIPAGQVSAMEYYSSLIKDFCESNNRLVYWDSYPYLCDSNTVGGGSIKSTAYHSDNLHLVPFGAMLASKPVLELLHSSSLVSGSMSLSRGVVSDQYSINPNPLFLGSGGTGSGSNGVTGTVPASVTVGRNGGTQALAISKELGDTQDAMLLTVSGSTTSGNYHEVFQTATITPAMYGARFKIKVRAQVKAATGLQTLEFATIGAGNTFGAYVNQGGRAISNITSGNGFAIDYMSDEFTMPSGTASAQVRLRIGTTSGGSAEVVFREFSLILA